MNSKLVFFTIIIFLKISLSFSFEIETRGLNGKLKGNKSFERLNKITKFKSTHNKIKNKTILSANIKNEENFLRGLVIARKNVYKKASHSVVLIDNFRKEGTEFEWNGYGSGSLIKQKGKIYGILTNWHVIEGGDAFGVCFRPKRGEEVCKEIHEGHLVSFNKKKDLALLYIQTDKKNHELIKLAKYSNAEIGDDAHAIGHPDGELWTFSTGMIGNIIKSTGSWYLIRNDKGEIFNSRLRGKFKLSNHKLSNPIATGDKVEFDEDKNNLGNYIINKI